MGATIGFLWFNAHPAEVFMGDTGSLAIGGALGTVAILLKAEFLLLVIGGVFAAEAISVLVQTGTYKWFKRTRGKEYADAHRVFRMAPLHHHFEKLGWAETTVVTRFYILGLAVRARGPLHAQGAMTAATGAGLFDRWRASGREVAVVGLGKSGVSATLLLRSRGHSGVRLRQRGRAGVRGLGAHPARGRCRWSSSAGTTSSESPGRRRWWWRRACRRMCRRSKPRAAPGSTFMPRWTSAFVALRGTRCIGITGTNGKTTTTSLIAHVLASCGPARPRRAGNIGRPLCEVARSSNRPDWLALELSSFQLHDAPNLKPAMGVLTNLAPNHLDRYATLDEYYGDKALLFRNADSASFWVTNADDPAVEEMTRSVPGTRVRFSIERRADAWYDRAGPPADAGRRGGAAARPSFRCWAITTWPMRWRRCWWLPARAAPPSASPRGCARSGPSRIGSSRCVR